MKYKVQFSGFAYVEADSEEEAEEKYFTEETIYKEEAVDKCAEIDEFIILV